MVEGNDVELEEPDLSFASMFEAWVAGYSPNTQRAYKKVLDDWVNWAQERAWILKTRALTHVKQTEAQQYILALSQRPGSPTEWGKASASYRTIHHRKNVLKSFYGHLIRNGHVTGPNPFDFPLNLQAEDRRSYERLTDEQIGKMLMQSDCATTDGRRDHAIMCLLFGAGLRRSEVCGLAVGDLTESNGIARIRLRRQKNKKLSVMPLPEPVSEALLAVKADRVEDGASATSPLFVKRKGKPVVISAISDCFVRRLFKSYLNRAGLDSRFSCHCARATAITNLLEAGLTYREVQEFSRHSSVKMVEVYDKRRFSDADSPATKLSYFQTKKTS